MLYDLDQSIRGLLRDATLGSGPVRVDLDPPTKDWAARRTAPTLNLFLADIREDSDRRAANLADEIGPDGHIFARRPVDRVFRVTYALTAWTAKPEDDHRLLGAALSLLTVHSFIPPEHCAGVLREWFDKNWVIPLSVGANALSERLATELWTSVGAEYRPSLSVVALIPVKAGQSETAGAPQTQPPTIRVTNTAAASTAGAADVVRGADPLVADGPVRTRTHRKPTPKPGGATSRSRPRSSS